MVSLRASSKKVNSINAGATRLRSEPESELIRSLIAPRDCAANSLVECPAMVDPLPLPLGLPLAPPPPPPPPYYFETPHYQTHKSKLQNHIAVADNPNSEEQCVSVRSSQLWMIFVMCLIAMGCFTTILVFALWRAR
ncbi:hypothetical protein IFR05_007938 [Cadophora sp. M221]|nr:hypothetical protein IFR05_007938 [Cadophora sp. M221]